MRHTCMILTSIYFLLLGTAAFADEAIFDETARQLFLESYTAMEEEDYERAKSLLQEVINLQPDFDPAYLNLSLLEKSEGNIEEALNLLQQAAEINPNQEKYPYNIGNILYDQGEFEEALPYYNQAIEINPEYYPAILNKGNTLLILDRNEEAIEVLQEIENNPVNAGEVLNSLGVAHRHLSQYDQAIDYFSRALEHNPQKLGRILNLATLYMALTQYENAQSVIQSGLNYHPDSFSLLYLYGQSYAFLEDYENALIYFDKAEEIQPNYLDIHYNKGICYNALEHYDDAELNYENAAEISRFEDFQALNNLGIIHAAEYEDYEAGKDYYLLVLMNNPDYPLVYYNLGVLYIRLGKYDIAKQFLEKALELDPAYENALHNLEIIEQIQASNTENEEDVNNDQEAPPSENDIQEDPIL